MSLVSGDLSESPGVRPGAQKYLRREGAAGGHHRGPDAAEGGPMSRGPGKWQRAILEALQTREQFYLTEILPEPTAATQSRRAFGHMQMAALRAAQRLAAQGRIVLNATRRWTNRPHWTGERWQ